MALKSAIITGASSGIGQALAIKMANDFGLNVLAIGRKKNALEETCAHRPDLIVPISADISRENDRSLISRHAQTLARPIGLFHGAGSFEIGLLDNLKSRTWQKSFETNVSSRLALTQALLPYLNGGRILFIGSDAAITPRFGAAAYSVSQAASDMLFKCLRLELKDHDISVGSFKPGLVKTPMVKNFLKVSQEKFPGIKAYEQLVKNGEIAPPQTVAAFAAWLLLEVSDEDFSENEWDIRNKNHHKRWLTGKLYPEN